MSVAGIEERTLVPDWEIDDVAGTNIRDIHVPPERPRGQRADRLELRGDGQRTHERLPGQRQSELITAQIVSLELPDPDFLLKGRLKRASERRRGEPAKVRDQAADPKVPGGGDVFDVDSERVAGLGTLDVDGSRLWIQEFGAGERPAGNVLPGPDSTFKSVVAVNHHLPAGTHPCDRFTIWAEHVAVGLRNHLDRSSCRHPHHLNALNGGSAQASRKPDYPRLPALAGFATTNCPRLPALAICEAARWQDTRANVT